MASGTRSIVWRSDIDAGRERPAFFLWGRGEARKGGMAGPAGGWLMGQLAAQLSSSQLFQLFMILLAREGMGERRRKREDGVGKGSYLLNK